MAKNWDYAGLSKWASEHGGPEAALNMLKEYYHDEGRKQGATSRNPLIALAGGVGIAVGVGSKWVYDRHKQKKKLTEAAEAEKARKVEKAEAEMIARMKEDQEAKTMETKISDEERAGEDE